MSGKVDKCWTGADQMTVIRLAFKLMYPDARNYWNFFTSATRTMSSFPAGTTELTGRALLEHPRYDSHSQIAIIFDAILKSSGIANGNPLLCCSFRYVIKDVGETLEAGIYDVVVRVSVRNANFRQQA